MMSEEAMATETHVCFEVFGFGDDPGVVCALMDMQPTQTWVKGEHYEAGSSRVLRTHSRWSLHSGLDQRDPLEAHLTALLALLEPKRDGVRRVMQRFTAKIGVAQYIREANPQFRIEPDILGRLADLGIPIYFDQYCLGEEGGS